MKIAETVDEAIAEHKHLRPQLNESMKIQAHKLFDEIVREIEINKSMQSFLLNSIIDKGYKHITVATYNQITGFEIPALKFKQQFDDIIKYMHKHRDDFFVKIKVGEFKNWLLCINSFQLDGFLILTIRLDKPVICNIL